MNTLSRQPLLMKSLHDSFPLFLTFFVRGTFRPNLVCKTLSDAFKKHQVKYFLWNDLHLHLTHRHIACIWDKFYSINNIYWFFFSYQVLVRVFLHVHSKKNPEHLVVIIGKWLAKIFQNPIPGLYNPPIYFINIFSLYRRCAYRKNFLAYPFVFHYTIVGNKSFLWWSRNSRLVVETKDNFSIGVSLGLCLRIPLI